MLHGPPLVPFRRHRAGRCIVIMSASLQSTGSACLPYPSCDATLHAVAACRRCLHSAPTTVWSRRAAAATAASPPTGLLSEYRFVALQRRSVQPAHFCTPLHPLQRQLCACGPPNVVLAGSFLAPRRAALRALASRPAARAQTGSGRHDSAGNTPAARPADGAVSGGACGRCRRHCRRHCHAACQAASGITSPSSGCPITSCILLLPHSPNPT